MNISTQSNLNRKYLTMFLISISIVLAFATGYADAAPYQELEPRKGYVPVYIRHGDTPLSEIHPKLAEAFQEDENVHVAKIESADLVEVKKDSTDEKPEKELKIAAKTITEKTLENSDAKDSDIASFDVVKGKDNTNDGE